MFWKCSHLILVLDSISKANLSKVSVCLCVCAQNLNFFGAVTTRMIRIFLLFVLKQNTIHIRFGRISFEKNSLNLLNAFMNLADNLITLNNAFWERKHFGIVVFWFLAVLCIQRHFHRKIKTIHENVAKLMKYKIEWLLCVFDMHHLILFRWPQKDRFSVFIIERNEKKKQAMRAQQHSQIHGTSINCSLNIYTPYTQSKHTPKKKLHTGNNQNVLIL